MFSDSTDIIIKTVARIFIPFIQLYALYVIMHGHHSPGGGFQGGVILSASLILLLITHGHRQAMERISEKLIRTFFSIGVLIYAGIGLLCIFFSGNFLDYGKLSILLKVDPVNARSLGILGIETGVGLTVMAVMVSIFYNISKPAELTKDEKSQE